MRYSNEQHDDTDKAKVHDTSSQHYATNEDPL